MTCQEQQRSRSRSLSPEFSPFDMGEDLVPLPQYKAAETLYIDFAGLLQTPLKVNVDPAGGCGGMTWPSGELLSKHMLRNHRKDLETARILEIGAGGGLVGLAVSLGVERKESSPIMITDQLEMLELMRANIELNEQQHKSVARILNWGEPLSQEVIDLKPDVILAADCVYFEPAFPLLLDTLKRLLELNPQAVVYFCFQKRRRADTQFMAKVMKAFKATQITMNAEDMKVSGKGQRFLYTFESKSKAV